MKKIYNVMASAAVIASLAIPASAFASSSYSTPTGVVSTTANSTINTTSAQRVSVTVDGGSMSNTPVTTTTPAAVSSASAAITNTGVYTVAPTVSGVYNGAANTIYTLKYLATGWTLFNGATQLPTLTDSGLTFTAPTGAPVINDAFTFTATAAVTSTTQQSYSVNLRLPANAATLFSGGTWNGGNTVYSLSAANVPTYTTGTTLNSVGAVTLSPVAGTGTLANGYQEWTLTVTPSTTAGVSMNDKGVFYLDLVNTKVPAGVSAVNLTVDAPSNSPLTSGNVQIAQVGSGNVDVAIDDTTSVTAGNSKAISSIRIKESQAGSLATGNGVKIKLPSGFQWDNTGAANVVWGDQRLNNVQLSKSDDGRTLYVKLPTGVTASNASTYLTLSGLTIDVDDSVAKVGTVDAAISGDSTYNESDLVVANYGDLTSSVSIANPATVVAGETDNSLNDGSITIQESSPGALVEGRTIKLTLGGNAKWNAGDLPVIDQSASDLEGLQLGNFQVSNNDPATIVATIANNGQSTGNKGAKVVFKKGGIDVAADQANQDVTVDVSGTAGLTGSATLAKIVAPATAKVNGSTPNLVIGQQGQALAPIDLTEAVSGAFDNSTGTTYTFNDGTSTKGNVVTLTFPQGVTVHAPSSVKVTSGDLVLADASSVTTSGNQVSFNIKSTSSTPSTIEVTGLVVDVDRTVAQGSFNVDLGGGSLVQGASTNAGVTAGAFDAVKKVGSFAVGNVVTALDGSNNGGISKFTIGQTSYTVNGEQKTLDVAPYTDGGRTYLPIRFVAEALGVTDDNIIWNDATKTVTLINGNKIASFKVGQSSYTLNGAVIPMDAAAQFKQNRNMIPLRYAAQALGVAISWDDATQTVTVGQ
jgi:trimeric autotransporter adhesin